MNNDIRHMAAQQGGRMATRRQYGALVAEKKPFYGSNVAGYWIHAKMGYYVVFSYGEHYPLYVFDRGQNLWYRNMDKYSATTSQHSGYAFPRGVTTTTQRTTSELRAMYE